MDKRKALRLFGIFVLLFCLFFVISCQTKKSSHTSPIETTSEITAQTVEEENGAASQAAETVLRAILECPNEEIAPITMHYFALEDRIPKSSEGLVTEQEEEAERWKKVVGPFFTEGDFDYFMKNCKGRNYFHILAFSYSLVISVEDIEAEESQSGVKYYNVSLLLTNADGEKRNCLTRWRVKYNVDHLELIRDLEMMDDGDILEAAESLFKKGRDE